MANWPAGLRGPRTGMARSRLHGGSGDPARPEVRRARRARTVRLHPDLVQLFTNWPANRSPRDKLVPLSMRTALRHIGDGIEWAGLVEESLGTGKRRAGAHSLRHSAARHWLMVGKVPAQRGQRVVGPCVCSGDAPDLPAYRGQRLRDGRRAVGFRLGGSFWSGCRRPASGLSFVDGWLGALKTEPTWFPAAELAHVGHDGTASVDYLLG